MEDITIFLAKAPEVYQVMLTTFYGSPERLDYHPEGILGGHIEITVGRALANNDLIMVAALHDICKGLQPVKSSGGTKNIVMANGQSCTYHSNPDHPYQAMRFIEDNPEIQKWIVENGANVSVVKNVVANHMVHKSYQKGLLGEKGGMKLSKQEKYAASLTPYELLLLDEFAEIDNMLKPYNL